MIDQDVCVSCFKGSVEVYYGAGHRTFVHNMSISCEVSFSWSTRSPCSYLVGGSEFHL